MASAIYNGRNGATRRRGRARPMSEINVTPFVDVMLVLLIVFMVTAPLLTVGVPVDLPKTKAAALNQDTEPLAVTINKGGQIYLQNTAITEEELVPKLEAIAKNGYDQRIFVRGDAAVDYGKVMAVMGLLSSAGFKRIGLVTDTEKKNRSEGAMRRGVIGSATLHVVVIGAAMFAWPHSLDVSSEPPPIVPVDLITIGEKTNITPTVKEEQQPQPEPQPQQEAVQEPEPQPQPEEAAEPAPPELQPNAQPEPTPAPPRTPTPRMKPQPDQTQQKFNVDNVLALLNEVAPKSNAPPNAKLASRTVRGIGDQNAMTMDLEDALRNQIAQCWSPPLGAPRADELVVNFDLFLNPDGTVARPPQLDANSAAAAAGDAYTRAAAEAARRAIYKCAPYKLPAERYDQWREINPFHFDPRQMMGQE